MNCLVTKLKGSVNNDKLLKLGELRIEFQNVGERKYFTVKYDADARIELKDAVFESDYSQYGNAMDVTPGNYGISFSAKPSRASLLNKYHITELALYDSGAAFDLEKLEMCKALNRLDASTVPVYGNVKHLLPLDNLSDVNVSSSNVEGDISGLAVKSLRKLQFPDCNKLIGNIAAISSLTNLTTLSFSTCPNVYGDISSLSEMTSLTELSFYSTKISGDISSIFKLKNLSNLDLSGTSVSGEINTLLSKMKEAGRTSGTFSIKLNDKCTYNGSTDTGRTVVLNFTTSEITPLSMQI